MVMQKKLTFGIVWLMVLVSFIHNPVVGITAAAAAIILTPTILKKRETQRQKIELRTRKAKDVHYNDR